MPNTSIRITGTVTLGKGAIDGEGIEDGKYFPSDAIEHRHKAGTDFGLNVDDTPVAAEKVVYVAENAATLKSAHALLVDTGTSTAVTFDVKKNGTTILSGAKIPITDSNTDREVVDGTISSASLVAGDVISISLAVTSSTGALGPYAWVEVDEVSPG